MSKRVGRMGHKTLLLLGALLGSQAAEPLVDVVVAHHDEDLSWVGHFSSPDVKFQIYSKGEAPPEEAVELPNVGRESHTYLYHIVKNYDSLAPWTVFTQGTKPAWGYRGGDSSSGHLSDNITFADYLNAYRQGKDAFFAISAAAHIPRGLQSTRLGILTNKLKTLSNGFCPAGGADGWSSWWFDMQHPHHKAGQQMLDFYHRYVLQDEEAAPKPITLGFVQGARFGLSRARIHTRPLAYYKALLEEVSKEMDPLQGYFMEAMWYDVFHPESPQTKSELCTYVGVPAGYGMSLNDMYVDTARRLNSQGMAADLIFPRSLADAYNPKGGDSLSDAYNPKGDDSLGDAYNPKGNDSLGDAYNPKGNDSLGDAYNPKPAPAGTKVAASLATSVPDVSPYLTAGPTQDALKAVWAETIANFTDGLSSSDITVTFSAGRRLAEALPRRLAAALKVDYEIFISEGSSVSVEDVKETMTTVTPEQVVAVFQEAVAASKDVPQNIKDSAGDVMVSEIAEPTIAVVGGTGAPTSTPTPGAPTSTPTPTDGDHEMSGAYCGMPLTAARMLTMAAIIVRTVL